MRPKTKCLYFKLPQDVAEIMQDFSKVLHEQADTLDTIEANVEQVQFFGEG